MQNVKIGPEFFSKAKLDYSNWRLAWVREIFQNSADSGASLIEFTFTLINGRVVASVSDNGRGMDRDTLENKLFSLGSSGKDFKAGAVGGFGKAKELLYFGQLSYVICTNDLEITGCGGQYWISNSKKPRIGTHSTVALHECDDFVPMVAYTRNLVEMSNFRGRVTVNNYEIMNRSHASGEEVRKFDCGTMFYNANKDQVDTIIFRVCGSPMFTKRIKNLNKGLIFEIATPSQTFLTSSRDNMHYTAMSEVEAFLSELTIDKTSALIKKNSFVRVYQGKRGRLCGKKRSVAAPGGAGPGSLNVEELLLFIVNTPARIGRLTPEVIQSIYMEYNFTVYFAKSEPLPDKWQLGTFCENALWVTWAWSVAVWDIFVMLGIEPEFDFGFVFDDSCEAKYSRETFLINPAHTDYKIKYTRTREGACKLLTIAAHEFIHHLGQEYHDETFASRYTDLMIKVMINSPHTITRMLDKEAQMKLDYSDYESQRALALSIMGRGSRR